nr:helix-turn-helix transcriptional regulator [Lunatimonas sp.]
MHRLSDPPSLRKLALEVGTNESHLKRHFKEAFHQTVYGFVIDKRMEKALELLKDKDLKIVEIAERLGYKHATHFSAAFKKYFGGHPKDYR